MSRFAIFGRPAARLGLYGVGLLAAFGAAFGLAGVVVPDSAVAAWSQSSQQASQGTSKGAAGQQAASAPQGQSLSQRGYLLLPVIAPSPVGEEGILSFQIRAPSGMPLTQYSTDVAEQLRLVVVRSDGAFYRSVSPSFDAVTGTWWLPWTWNNAGSYRAYVEFTPADQNEGSARSAGAADAPEARSLILSRTVDVAGAVTPEKPVPRRIADTGPYTVTLNGDLRAGEPSTLTATVARDGKPVTILQSAQGAFGRLLALRQGDLAYLTAQPDAGARPEIAGQSETDTNSEISEQRGGPDLGFSVQVPTAGLYLLYLDFQVDGRIYTARFALEAAPAQQNEQSGPAAGGGHSGH